MKVCSGIVGAYAAFGATPTPCRKMLCSPPINAFPVPNASEYPTHAHSSCGPGRRRTAPTPARSSSAPAPPTSASTRCRPLTEPAQWQPYSPPRPSPAPQSCPASAPRLPAPPQRYNSAKPARRPPSPPSSQHAYDQNLQPSACFEPLQQRVEIHPKPGARRHSPNSLAHPPFPTAER
jgi:hypothetical protein